jgi:hypothetical protein
VRCKNTLVLPESLIYIPAPSVLGKTFCIKKLFGRDAMKNKPTDLGGAFRTEQFRAGKDDILPAKYQGLPEGAPTKTHVWRAPSKGYVWNRT